MLRMLRWISNVIVASGKLCLWLPLLMAALIVAIIFARQVNIETTAVQEFVMYLHGFVIMASVGWVWSRKGHVSIDLISRLMSVKARRWLEGVGVVVLVWPTCAMLFITVEPFIVWTWSAMEKSAESHGLPFVYLQKTMLALLPCLWLMQSFVRLTELVAESKVRQS